MGVPLAALLREAARPRARSTSCSRGSIEASKGRSSSGTSEACPLAEALESGADARLRDERPPAAPTARLPAPPRRAGVVRHDERQVARRRSRCSRRRTPGYQVTTGYRFRQTEDEEGRPVTRMRPRSLMVPPGIPDFLTRDRVVDGPVRLEGRAWCGRSSIARVEVSDDGGESWHDAELERDVDDRWAWMRWTFDWKPSRPGTFTLCCRATDESGETQPLEPEWNLGGYENNAVQQRSGHRALSAAASRAAGMIFRDGSTAARMAARHAAGGRRHPRRPRARVSPDRDESRRDARVSGARAAGRRRARNARPRRSRTPGAEPRAAAAVGVHAPRPDRLRLPGASRADRPHGRAAGARHEPGVSARACAPGARRTRLRASSRGGSQAARPAHGEPRRRSSAASGCRSRPGRSFGPRPSFTARPTGRGPPALLIP